MLEHQCYQAYLILEDGNITFAKHLVHYFVATARPLVLKTSVPRREEKRGRNPKQEDPAKGREREREKKKMKWQFGRHQYSVSCE